MSQPKLSGSGSCRTPRHVWTTEQKRCLLVLLTTFHFEWDQISTVFHNVYRDEINTRDFPHGLPLKSLKLQYGESKKDNTMSWATITRPKSWTAESALRDQLANKIRRCLLMVAEGQGVLEKTPSPPTSSSRERPRKRKRDVCDDIEIDEASERDSLTHISAESSILRHSKMVLVRPGEAINPSAYRAINDNAEERIATPRKPVKQMQTGLLSPPGTVLVFRNSGPPINATPQVRAEMEAGYFPPSEQEAHPPLGGLFYRFWDPEQSQGRNSAQGFVAKRYVYSNAVPSLAFVPPARYLDPTDLWHHLNESHESTPFVSVSDSLTWSLSKVLKLVKSGEWKSAHLSVVDSTKLPAKTVFHAAGFYRQLKKIRPFTNGAHRGVSSHEYLIWRDIPQCAMLTTTSIRDLVAATVSTPALARLLRFGILSAPGAYQIEIRLSLQRGQVSLDPSTATSMAKLAQILQLPLDSPFEHHRHLTHDLVSSYKLLVTHHTPQEWLVIASSYAHVFVRATTGPVSAITQAKLKLAFLEGVRLGAVTDLRLPRLDAKTMGTLQRKARLIGIDDAGRMIAGEADAVKVHVGLEQRRQWRAISGVAGRMVEGGEEADSDGESVFEMDDDGVVL